MLDYQPTSDDESFIGQPLRGATWHRWAAGAQHFAGTRGRVVSAGYVHQPLHLSPGTPNSIDVVIQASPWERLYAVRVTLGMRSASLGRRDWTGTLNVLSENPAGLWPSAAQRTLRILPPLQPEPAVPSDFGAWRDRAVPVVTPVQWPIEPDLPPDMIRLTSGWLVHEPDVNLLAARDRVIRIWVSGFELAGVPIEIYLMGYCIVGYDDREIV